MSNGAPAQGKKKGLSNWAWIGIGCGVLLMMAVIAVVGASYWVMGKAKDVAADFEANPGLAAARLIVKATPDLEEVDVDEDAGTITVRNTSSGEVITVNFDDVKDGRLSFSSGDQEVVIEASGEGDNATVNITGDKGKLSFTTGDRVRGERPEWVALYPGCEPESQHVMTRENGVSGGFQLSTDDSVDEVAEYYRKALEENGFEVAVNSFSGGGEAASMVTGTDEEGARTVVVNAHEQEGGTVIGVTYNQGE